MNTNERKVLLENMNATRLKRFAAGLSSKEMSLDYETYSEDADAGVFLSRYRENAVSDLKRLLAKAAAVTAPLDAAASGGEARARSRANDPRADDE